MAEETKEQSSESSRKNSAFSFKTLLVLVAVLLIEAVAITAVFMLAGGPSPVQAEGAAEDAAALAEQPVEEMVVADKFTNSRVGRTYIYDTEIYIVIRRRDQATIRSRIDSMQAQISTDIATIYRRAEPTHLNEPTLATLTRQIQAALDDRFGRDPETGESLVQQVLIRKHTPFRADM